jgi:hypothetical protein
LTPVYFSSEESLLEVDLSFVWEPTRP